MKDPTIQAIDEATPELIEQLQKAFASIATRIDTDKLSHAILTGDSTLIYRAAGVSDDGTEWPALAAVIAYAVASVLVPAYGFITSRIWQDLDATEDDTQQAAQELDDALTEALTEACSQIVADTLAGFKQAASIIQKDTAFQFNASNLIAIIGMTSRQVIYFFGVNRAIDQLRTAQSKAATEQERAKITTAITASLPALIAAPLRKIPTNNIGLITDKAARTFGFQLAQALREHRIKPLAVFNASTLINLAQDVTHIAAQRLGLIHKDTRKFWVTMHDERVRHTHSLIESMNTKGVPLTEAFNTPLGFKIRFPPAERNCRCYVTLGMPK